MPGPFTAGGPLQAWVLYGTQGGTRDNRVRTGMAAGVWPPMGPARIHGLWGRRRSLPANLRFPLRR